MLNVVWIFKRFYLPVLISIVLMLAGCGKNIKNSDAVLKKSVDIALQKGDWESALSYAELAMKTDSKNLDAKVMYSIALENTGKNEEAIKQLKKVVSEQPENFLAQLSLGKLLFSKKDYEGAYDHLANAYNLKPDNLNALILYVQCSAKLQAPDTGKLFLKLLETKQFKNNPTLYNNLGVYYAHINNHSDAVKYMIKAYKISPDNPMIIANLGIFCDRYLQKPQKAKFFYRKFISVSLGNSLYDAKRKEFSIRLRELAQSNS